MLGEIEMEEETPKQSNPIKTGWITLSVGLFFCSIWGLTGGFIMIGMPNLPAMIAIFLALPLLLASLILSIVGMCKNHPGKGTLLLVATFVLPAIVVVVSGIISSLLSV